MNQLGKYSLVAEVARGGMGIVYLAVAQGPARFSKLLVIKELKPEYVEHETYLEMFLEEARLAARLSHPNIVQTYEVGSDGQRHYIVMDYLDGVPLARVIRKKRPAFTRNMHLRVICEALSGLHYAHTLQDFDGTPLGIVHRDCTPQNVFLTFDGTAKLVDFGVAKALDSSIETRTGVIKGKPAYMAPEQVMGETDPRADLFSVGVMIWEAIAGHRMWEKKGDTEVLVSVMNGSVPSIRDEVPDAPDELVAICEKALKRDRDQRYPTALSLREDLERFLQKEEPGATMREVGQVVSEMFAAERTRTRSMIESQIVALRSTPPEKLLSLPPPDGSSTGSNLQVEAGDLGVGDVLGDRRVPEAGPSSTAGAERGPSGAPRRRSKALWSLLGGGGFMVLLVGFGVALAARHRAEMGAVAHVAVPLETKSVSWTPAPPASKSEEPAPSTRVPAHVVSVTEGKAAPKPSAAPPEKPTAAAYAPPPRWTPPARAHAPPASPGIKAPELADDSRAKQGFLTIDTYPWTRVSTNGRVLGDTPLVRVPLAPGTYTLVLENAAEKVKQTTVVTIKPGEAVSRRLAF